MARRAGDQAPYVVDAAGLRSLHFGPARVQSRMLLRDPGLLVFDYTCLMMGFLLFLPRPRRIGLIGLGGGSLLKFCHRHVAGSRCEAVERDARVIALRDAFALPRDDRRCRIRLGDGVNFIKSETDAFDAILLDGYDESGMPARLRSRSFVTACRKALRADGMLVVNVDSNDAGRDAFLANVCRVFEGCVLCVLDEDGGNCVVFAGRRLQRRIGEIRRPAAVDRAGWAQLVPAALRIRAAHDPDGSLHRSQAQSDSEADDG